MDPEIAVLLVASGSVALLGGVAAVTWFLERLSRTSTHPGPGRGGDRAAQSPAGCAGRQPVVG